MTSHPSQMPLRPACSTSSKRMTSRIQVHGSRELSRAPPCTACSRLRHHMMIDTRSRARAPSMAVLNAHVCVRFALTELDQPSPLCRPHLSITAAILQMHTALQHPAIASSVGMFSLVAWLRVAMPCNLLRLSITLGSGYAHSRILAVARIAIRALESTR